MRAVAPARRRLNVARALVAVALCVAGCDAEPQALESGLGGGCEALELRVHPLVAPGVAQLGAVRSVAADPNSDGHWLVLGDRDVVLAHSSGTPEPTPLGEIEGRVSLRAGRDGVVYVIERAADRLTVTAAARGRVLATSRNLQGLPFALSANWTRDVVLLGGQPHLFAIPDASADASIRVYAWALSDRLEAEGLCSENVCAAIDVGCATTVPGCDPSATPTSLPTIRVVGTAADAAGTSAQYALHVTTLDPTATEHGQLLLAQVERPFGASPEAQAVEVEAARVAPTRVDIAQGGRTLYYLPEGEADVRRLDEMGLRRVPAASPEARLLTITDDAVALSHDGERLTATSLTRSSSQAEVELEAEVESVVPLRGGSAWVTDTDANESYVTIECAGQDPL